MARFRVGLIALATLALVFGVEFSAASELVPSSAPFSTPLEALLNAPQAEVPGVPASVKLLANVTVPATVPFNKGGVPLKTRFSQGAAYYVVASGTAQIPNYGGSPSITIDAVYCFEGGGGCNPVSPVFFGGFGFQWFKGRTFRNFAGSYFYGSRKGAPIKYQPSHRYVYKLAAPVSGRLAFSGPQTTNNSSNTGAFSVQVYGPPPPPPDKKSKDKPGPPASLILYAVHCKDGEKYGTIYFVSGQCNSVRLVLEAPRALDRYALTIERYDRRDEEWKGVGCSYNPTPFPTCTLIVQHVRGQLIYRAAAKAGKGYVDTSSTVELNGLGG